MWFGGWKEPKASIALRCEQSPRAKLTSAQVLDIRRRYASREASQIRLAKEYGVSQTAISKIVRQSTWADLSPQPAPPRPALRARRQALGLTQLQLARRSGLTRAQVCLIERGIINEPHKQTLERLATGLEIQPDDLLTLLDEKAGDE